jgi:hypothetical protein
MVFRYTVRNTVILDGLAQTTANRRERTFQPGSLLSNDAVTPLENLAIISISSRVRQRLFWADGQNTRSDPRLGLVVDLASEQNREPQSADTFSPFGAA